MCLIDSRVEGGEQRETASKCLHLYTVEATSRTHVYTERLWSEALRTASCAGGGWGELIHVCCAVCLQTHSSSHGPNSPVIHTQVTTCADLITCTARSLHVQTLSHMHTPLITYTQLFMHAHLVSYAGLITCAQIVTYAEVPCKAQAWGRG